MNAQEEEEQYVDLVLLALLCLEEWKAGGRPSCFDIGDNPGDWNDPKKQQVERCATLATAGRLSFVSC